MAKKIPFLETKDGVDLTPMIDVVFLLLAYFMVAVDITQEADLSIKLPAKVPDNPQDTPPDELVVEIQPSGVVLLNGNPMDNPASIEMPQLVSTLSRMRSASAGTGAETAVTILADPDSLHDRSIAVLNACAAADIKFVMFAQE